MPRIILLKQRARCEALAVLVYTLAFCHTAAAGSAEESGDILRVAVPTAAWALTFHYDDPQGRRDFYQSFAANIVATYALKQVVDKERIDGSDDDAFPSGHASTAFQGAAFLHRRYGIRRAWWAYALAAYTGWTRIDADEHDAADVLGGAAVGIASSFLLTQSREQSVVWVPEIGPNYVGLRFSLNPGTRR
ncbi:MAG: phosphatase PAP2 family protein [Woeseia sp.]